MAKYAEILKINAEKYLDIFDDIIEFRELQYYCLGSVDFPVFLERVELYLNKYKTQVTLAAIISGGRCDKNLPDYFNLAVPIESLIKKLGKDFIALDLTDSALDQMICGYCFAKFSKINDCHEIWYAVSEAEGDIVINHGFNMTLAVESTTLSSRLLTLKTGEEFLQVLKEFSGFVSLLVNCLLFENKISLKPIELLLQPDASYGVEYYDEVDSFSSTGRRLGDDKQAAVKGLLTVKPNVKFQHIGGCRQAKREMGNLAKSLRYREVYKKWGTMAPRGVILYGPPGTGKTTLVKALANESQATFFSVKLSEIFSKWVGESEQNVVKLFEHAKNHQPSIIFVDELDALSGNRDYLSDHDRQVVATFLNCLDGLERDSDITFVGATNRIDTIDPAFLRPGRVDLKIKIDLPSLEDRLEILQIYLERSQTIAGHQLFKDDIDWRLIAERTAGRSGADIEEIFRRVLNEKVDLELNKQVCPDIVDQAELLAAVDYLSKENLSRFNKPIGFCS